MVSFPGHLPLAVLVRGGCREGCYPVLRLGLILVALGWTSLLGAALVLGDVRERIFISAGAGSSETLQGVEGSRAS